MSARVIAWIALCGSVLLTAPRSGVAEILSLTHKNSQIEVDPLSTAGLFTWSVDGTDHMNQQWFWFGVGKGRESPLNSLNLTHHEVGDANHLGNQVHLRYRNSSLSVDVLYSLFGGEAGSHESLLVEQLSITNISKKRSNVRLYEYTDLDLDGTPSRDTAVYDSSTSTITQAEDPFIATVTSISPDPSRWEIAPFPVILDRLNDSSRTTLANGTSPLGPDNITHAFQYNFSLEPRESAFISKEKFIDPTRVSEPAPLLLLGSAMVGLAIWARRRRDCDNADPPNTVIGALHGRRRHRNC